VRRRALLLERAPHVGDARLDDGERARLRGDSRAAGEEKKGGEFAHVIRGDVEAGDNRAASYIGSALR